MRTTISSFEQWWIAFRYQLRFYLRTYRFLGLLLFVGILGVIFLAVQVSTGSSGVSGTGLRESASLYLTGNLSLMGMLLIVVGAFFGGDAIAMDFGSGTGYYMLVQPVERTALLMGRYVAAFTSTVPIILTFYAVWIAGAIHFFGMGSLPSLGLLISLGLALLFSLAVIAVAFLFSSFFRSPAIAIVVTILVLFLALSVVTTVIESAGHEPWFSLYYAGQAISEVLDPNFQHTSVGIIVGPGGGGQSTSFSPYPWEGAAIMTGYLAFGLFLSILAYRWKEMKG